VYATLMLWKKAGQPWTDDELMPVKKLKPSAKNSSVAVAFSDGSNKTITFNTASGTTK